MDIRQLETFLRIVDTGSFAAAAQTLNATQSTVSARIRELERSLGVDLFDRSQHRARLTAKGQDLVVSAREIVALASRVRHRIGDKDALTGTVRLGVVGLVAITWLPKLMGALRERYPNLAVVLDMGLTATLVDKLRNGDLDLALVTGPVVQSGLRAISLGYDEFVWMCSPALAVPARKLSPAELATWPVLGLSSQSHHYPVIERWFRDANADYRPVISCNNVRVLAELTVSCLGVSLLPRASYHAEIAAGKLRVIDTAPQIGPVQFVALHRHTTTDPIVAAVAELALETSEFERPGNA
ncbi:LysR family transcriptional regulator [Caballeronia sp. EK]|uniref:LysR family transcriptional regulator n=1 Tax=Caballeronia sp. EK TaxID=2767469 RepID=UPI001654C7E9|nr:LysR family transcriptional regulator [Caballeronia sp. EK]MBC8642185.1 LysR family transcriptional regulator [Caballeronia sp. EK]